MSYRSKTERFNGSEAIAIGGMPPVWNGNDSPIFYDAVKDDINNGLISVPSWFKEKNMEWVKTGHISEAAFLVGYSALVESGVG